MYVEHEGKSAVVMHRSGSGSSMYVSHPLLLVPLDTRAGPQYHAWKSRTKIIHERLTLF